MEDVSGGGMQKLIASLDSKYMFGKNDGKEEQMVVLCSWVCIVLMCKREFEMLNKGYIRVGLWIPPWWLVITTMGG